MAVDWDKTVAAKEVKSVGTTGAPCRSQEQTWQQQLWVTRFLYAESSFTLIKKEKWLPENKVVDFELGLYHACRPQSYSKDICLCGHVLRRHDAAHVLKETGKGGGRRRRQREGCKKVKEPGETRGRRKRAAGKLITWKQTWDQKKNQVSLTGVEANTLCVWCGWVRVLGVQR